MKLKSFIALLIVFGMFINSSAVFAFAGGDDNKLGANVAKIDNNKFISNVKTALNGNVMGYQVVLLKNGQIAAEYADGWARNNADGNMKMTNSTPSNIGSTAKFFAGVTLLQLFEREKNRYSNPSGRSVDQWLDTKMYIYLPKVWQQDMHESIKQITFRDLLEHRGGFIHNDKDMDGDMYNYLVKGVSSDQSQPYAYGKRNYANANITILTFLIPAIARPHVKPTIDLHVAQQKLKGDAQYIQDYLAAEYESWVKEKVFGKITPAINPSCRPTVEMANTFARGYSSAKHISKSTVTPANAKGCYAQGGWYVSSRQLAAFVANFNASETLVSNELRTKMFDDDDADNRLVWSRTTSENWFDQHFKIKTMPFMGGTAGGGRATVLMLPNGYYAIGIINSEDFSSGELTEILRDSFKKSVTF